MAHFNYTPLTATPFKHNAEYQEIVPTDCGLAAYIRCFWGSGAPYIKTEKKDTPELIVPDTCVDIIYNIDYTEDKISGGFCGINDESFYVWDSIDNGHLVSTFSIRFYAWGAYAFSEDSLKGTLNGFYDVQSRFYWLDKELRERLFETGSFTERVSLVEHLFLEHMPQLRQNSVVSCALNQMLRSGGTQSVAQLAKESYVSSRQLERLFHEYVGITPKKLNNLIRYQCLWNDILKNPGLSVLDAVYKYGYADESHLTKEFKRYHTMDIQKAKAYAYNHVGNIQDFRAES